MQEDSLEISAPRPHTEEIVIGDEMSGRAKVISTFILVALVAASVGYVWLMSSLPRIEGVVPIKGLHLPATVSRDHSGLPRIAARSVRDGYFTLGWVHAQDRIWQMELQRRVGAGRLAEIVGDKGLGNDRFMRTLGLYRLAEQGFDQLDRPTRDALIAYAEGINSWLNAHSHRLPAEFFALGIEPEPWTPADSLVWARMMALQLANNWQDEVLMAKLGTRFDARRLRELWPGYPPDAPVTVAVGALPDLASILPETAEPRLASNVWAVDGTRTESGKPLLANDPHLGFQVPALWYLAAIEAPGLTLSGATVPGVPFHLVGHNGRIAWGTTTTHADTVDLFVETLVDEDAYQTPSGPRAFDTRQEVIKVKGAPDEVLTVRQTRHGPVVSDLLAKDLAVPGKVVALKSTALEAEDLTAQGIFRLNRAVDWKGFRSALADFHAPVQNFAYADTAGTIGFVTAGRVPLRRSGNGALPVDGAAADGDWTGWIPAAKMPSQLAPKSGAIVNANNRVTGKSYPYTISAHWPEGYRARRIEAMLNGRKGLSLPDMATMQLDDTSLAAVELMDILADTETAEPKAREAMALLAAWDGRSAADRPEPLIFAAWMEQLWKGVFADELAGDLKSYGALRPYVLRDALTINRHWCDDVATPEAESCETVAGRALEQAVAQLSARTTKPVAAWRWGDEHKATFIHPIFGKLPLIGDMTNVVVPTPGDDFTVNRGTFLPGDYRHLHGAGLRVVFDLADLSNSRFVVALGQSGNLLSRHFNDLTDRWLINDGLTLTNRQNEEAVLTLEPGY